MGFKQGARDFGCSIGYALWFLVILAIVVAGVAVIDRVVYPWYLQTQREGVEASKSYNDSRNQMLFTYMSEWRDLETKVAEAGDANPAAVTAYRGQQQAILDSMCQLTGTMNAGTVAPDITAFLAQRGGCR